MPAHSALSIDYLPEPHLLVSGQGQLIDANAAARRCFNDLRPDGYLRDLISGPKHGLDRSLRLWSRSGHFLRGLVYLVCGDKRYATYGFRVTGTDIHETLILVKCLSEQTANDRFVELTRRVNALNREIAHRLKVESELEAERELAQVTLHSIGDAVITTDLHGRVKFLNPVAETMTGWTEAEARDMPLSQVFRIFHEHTRKPAENPVEKVLARGQIVGLANHTMLQHRDGREFAIDDSAAPIRSRSGELVGVVMVFHDVTDARKLSEKVSYQATHDWLTGLLNRQAFENELLHLLETADMARANHSLMFLDLDQFKIINDTCGHLAGDALLRALAPVMKSHLRHSDLLARLGGDEFAVLLQDCPKDVAGRIAMALKDAVQNFGFVWEARAFNVGVSIGQVNFANENWSLTDLLSAADNACYVAKENGRNRIHTYSSADHDVAQRFRQSRWVGDIRDGLNDNRFCLYCQRITPTASGRSLARERASHHFELLLRMRDTNGHLIAPMAFIPAAERYNLMINIDQWVIETAFAKLAATGCVGVHTCSINLSGASLGDEAFLRFICQCFKRFAVPPQIICFEITETVAIANLTRARAMMSKLKDLGCRFSLDDFGSGMSSFGYLKSLPVDFLKIDGAFITNLHEDPIDQAMVTAINDIGHVMGLKTIAEFVETPAVEEQLNSLGVDYVQGYGIARPESLDDLLASLASKVLT